MSWFDLQYNEDRDLVDWETCSWCLIEVNNASLTEAKDGARICPSCKNDPKNKDFV